jgi:hypothetical protein
LEERKDAAAEKIDELEETRKLLEDIQNKDIEEVLRELNVESLDAQSRKTLENCKNAQHKALASFS